MVPDVITDHRRVETHPSEQGEDITPASAPHADS